jgi:hypothetical protein
MFFDNTAKTYDFYVRNNVFHGAEDVAIAIYADRWNGLDKLVMDDNLYCQPPEKRLVRWGSWRVGRVFLASQFDAYKEFTGKDARSRLVTPKQLMIKPSKLSLRIDETTPLKAILFYSDGTQVDVTYWTSFTSSDPAVASVEDGKAVSRLHPPSPRLKGLRAGRTVITASFEELTVTALVMVGR